MRSYLSLTILAAVVCVANLGCGFFGAEPESGLQAQQQAPAQAAAHELPPADLDPAAERPKLQDWQRENVCLEPSQGRPVIITPGETFYLLTRLPAELGEAVTFSLVHHKAPTYRYNLRRETPLSLDRRGVGAVVVRAPAEAPDGLYDVEVCSPNETFYSRNALKLIRQPRTKFRFVHLSDMNIDDPGAPEFDDRLVDEVNLLAPEFIIATGDFTAYARMLNNERDWTRVLSFLGRFDAPVYILCGDRDHQGSFTRQIAGNELSTIDYGDYHGLLVADAGVLEIGDDQLRWVQTDLQHHRDAPFNFIATHNDELTILDRLREHLNLPVFAEENRLRMIITGGHEDWDFRRHARKLADLPGVAYVGTHQASTALLGRATGTSHYRVIEVDGEEFSYVYPNDMTDRPLLHSVPVGSIRTYYGQPNDGSAGQIVVTVQNALNQTFEECNLWLRVAKSAGDAQRQPQVTPGRVVQSIDAGEHWLVQVAFDLPDKGGVKIAASTTGALPAPSPLRFALQGGPSLSFAQRVTDDGVEYFASNDELKLTISNPGDQPITARPIVRLNGNKLSFVEDDGPSWPVELAPGASVTLSLDLKLSRVSPGPHQLQVFLLDDPLKRLTTFPVELRAAS